MAFWGVPPGPPPIYASAPPGPQQMFGPSPPYSAMHGPPPPYPAIHGSTRYHYHTRDGGPPNDGKPPATPGAPPSMPPWGFAPAPPGAPFGAPPQGPMACYGPSPSSQPPPPYVCFPTGSGPPPAPAPAPANFSGAIFAQPADDNSPAPGNRFNGRLVKVDDGSGVLLPEHMTTFHVFNPGFHPEKSRYRGWQDITIQGADSQWTVKRVIERLGGLDVSRLYPSWVGRTDLVGMQQWHEEGGGTFSPGTTVMYNDPKAICTIAEMGWGSDCGKAGKLPPVWVVLYPVKLKPA